MRHRTLDLIQQTKYVTPGDFIPFLREHGFDHLTGEACSFSMRSLFDLDERAQEIMTGYLGLRHMDLPRASNHGEPWGSMMIDHYLRRRLVIFILLLEWQNVVEIMPTDADGRQILAEGGVLAYNNDVAESIEEYLRGPYVKGNFHRYWRTRR